MASNQDLKARRLAALPRGLASQTSVYADKAENAEIWDVDGRRFVDFTGGIAVLNTGHRHPKVMAAAARQAERFTHTAFQVMGIAVYQWLPLYGTLWLIMVAMGTRMLAYCTRTMNAAALQIHPELEEAAWVAGLSRWRTFTGVFLPLMAPALFYAALMVGMLAARDLTLPLIMNSGGTPLVSVLIFDLQTNGETASAAAVALYMIVVLVLLVLAARKLPGMAEPGLEK